MTLKILSDKNIADKVADEVREAIQSGQLEPGERLIERKLAERLGVSHIPVREALAKLTEEGIVERRSRKGARVAELDAHQLDEISSLRIILEQFVCIRVQERWNEKSEARLRKMVKAMVEAAKRGDGDLMFSLDERFHALIWELSDHRLLMDTTAQLRGRLNGFLRAANKALEPQQLITHAMSHSDIVDAVASRDPARAQQVIAKHIEVAAARIAVRREMIATLGPQGASPTIPVERDYGSHGDADGAIAVAHSSDQPSDLPLR